MSALDLLNGMDTPVTSVVYDLTPVQELDHAISILENIPSQDDFDHALDELMRAEGQVNDILTSLDESQDEETVKKAIHQLNGLQSFLKMEDEEPLVYSSEADKTVGGRVRDFARKVGQFIDKIITATVNAIEKFQRQYISGMAFAIRALNKMKGGLKDKKGEMVQPSSLYFGDRPVAPASIRESLDYLTIAFSLEKAFAANEIKVYMNESSPEDLVNVILSTNLKAYFKFDEPPYAYKTNDDVMGASPLLVGGYCQMLTRDKNNNFSAVTVRDPDNAKEQKLSFDVYTASEVKKLIDRAIDAQKTYVEKSGKMRKVLDNTFGKYGTEFSSDSGALNNELRSLIHNGTRVYKGITRNEYAIATSVIKGIAAIAKELYEEKK